MSLKPWREIFVPHPDVLIGTFQQSEFAADLTAPVSFIAYHRLAAAKYRRLGREYPMPQAAEPSAECLRSIAALAQAKGLRVIA